MVTWLLIWTYRLSEQYSGKLDFLSLMVDDPQNKEVLLHASVEGTRLGWSSIAEQEKLANMWDILLTLYYRKKIDSMQAEMESCLYNSTHLEKVGEARH